jgi:hypothetical protein
MVHQGAEIVHTTKEVNYFFKKSIKINKNISGLINFTDSFSHYMFRQYGPYQVVSETKIKYNTIKK